MIRIPVHFIRKARNPYKKIKLRIKREFGWLGIPKIIPYIGYGTSEKVFISGSVIEDYGLTKPDAHQTIWKNLVSMLKRYIADEIAGVQVEVQFKGITQVVTTDQSGMFHCVFTGFENESTDIIWESAYFTLLEIIMTEQELETATGEVMVIRHQPQFGIISDIDDTLLISHSTKTFMKLSLMLFKNAYTRMPFKGIAAFYQALQNGNETPGFNPFFYVSSSEYNLFDLLYDFFAYRHIPIGPLMLREMELNIFKLWKSGGGKHEHKITKIRHIFQTFANVNFVLIGDSSQKDPEIYMNVIMEFPGRVKTVYIRNISSVEKAQRIKAISDEAKVYGVDFLLVKDSEEAARHALEKGYIIGEMVTPVEKEKQEQVKAETVHGFMENFPQYGNVTK